MSQRGPWPTFFVVGAVKSGTTSLHSYLRSHPQVFMPESKEPGYFAARLRPVPRSDAKYCCSGDEKRYHRLYRGAASYRAAGDVSPCYLWDEDAAAKIRRAVPSARIVIMLRDPVERAYSHYLLKIQEGKEKRPFLEALKQDTIRDQSGWWDARLYIECGLYYEQVKRFLDIFGREQVAIFCFEDLKRDPKQVLDKLARHIGVELHLFDETEVNRVHNPYKKPRMRWVPKFANLLGPRVRHMLLPESLRWRIFNSSLLFDMKKPPQCEESKVWLQQIYAADIEALEELLGYALPQLRRSWVARKMSHAL
jgi:hypothetical protein